MNKEHELRPLPCPFCGGPARTFHYNGTTQATCAAAHVECAGSDVCAPVGMWNRRSSDEQAEVVGHPDDFAVDRFAIAMKAKLAQKRAEGRGGWDNKTECSQADLSEMLYTHYLKGDPIDVANFAMMLHQRGEVIGSWEPEPKRNPPGVLHGAKVYYATGPEKRRGRK